MATTQTPTKRKKCDVDGCEKPARTGRAAHCPMHYHRLYRNKPLGDATPKKRTAKLPECVIVGCINPDKTSGYCSMHAARIARHGDPHTVIASNERDLPTGTRHHNWAGTDAGYGAAHDRVKRLHGPAREQACTTCGGAAAHWSYDHTDPDERHEIVRGGYLVAYSTNPDHYSPRCVPCHKRYDLDRIDSTPPTGGAIFA